MKSHLSGNTTDRRPERGSYRRDEGFTGDCGYGVGTSDWRKQMVEGEDILRILPVNWGDDRSHGSKTTHRMTVGVQNYIVPRPEGTL